MSEEEPNKVTRRSFMKATIVGIGGLITAAYGIPAIAYVLGPALQKDAGAWIQLGSVSKIEVGIPTLFKATLQTQTGWITAEEEFSVYVLTDDGQSYVVMSNVCTHLGCRVRWIAEKDSFFCPCHNGAFSKTGSVIGGPPPRSLDRFDSKVENGILFVKRG
jgi:menaquinol-cytochrome c reductase iron-sulfur subunit